MRKVRRDQHEVIRPVGGHGIANVALPVAVHCQCQFVFRVAVPLERNAGKPPVIDPDGTVAAELDMFVCWFHGCGFITSDSWLKKPSSCLDSITMKNVRGLFSGHINTHTETTMTALNIDDLPAAIRQAKRALREQLPNYRQVFADVEQAIIAEAKLITEQRNRGEAVIPEIQFSDIAEQRVTTAQVDLIKAQGACVIRNVFDRALVESWDRDIANYVERNDLDTRLQNRAEDKYFGQLASSKPQIYGIYCQNRMCLLGSRPL